MRWRPVLRQEFSVGAVPPDAFGGEFCWRLADFFQKDDPQPRRALVKPDASATCGIAMSVESSSVLARSMWARRISSEMECPTSPRNRRSNDRREIGT